MLDINATPEVWVDHEETGTRYKIGPLLPRDNKKLVKKATVKGELDYVLYNGLVVEHVVREWEGVGGKGEPLQPTETTPAADGSPEVKGTKRVLGEKFPSVANFLHQRASSAKLFCDEADAGKND